MQLALGKLETDAIETSWQDAGVLGAPSDPLPNDPDWAGRVVFSDIRTAQTPASPDALWRVIVGIGGENGWYSSPVLWAVRGWMDRLVGGIGLAGGGAAVTGWPWAMRWTSGAWRRWNREGCCACGPR